MSRSHQLAEATPYLLMSVIRASRSRPEHWTRDRGQRCRPLDGLRASPQADVSHFRADHAGSGESPKSAQSAQPYRRTAAQAIPPPVPFPTPSKTPVTELANISYSFRFIDSQPFRPLPSPRFRPLASYRIARNEVLMTEIELTPEQRELILVICSGGTVHGVIAIANVLRKDVLAWRRELPHFEAALQQAFADRDWMLREEAVTLVSLAYQTLGDILRDTEAPASVQFKAARFIVERGTAPAPEMAQLATKRTEMHETGDPPGPKAAQHEANPCGNGSRNNLLPGAA
jgi:hypothetical protein